MIEVIKVDDGELVLKGDATVAYVDQLHREIGEAFSGYSGKILVDLEGVKEMDSAGAQTLIAFRKSHGAEKVRLTRCPEKIRDMLDKSGLSVHLF